MREAFLVLVLLAVFAVALDGPAGKLVNPGTPISQHAEVIIGLPGGG